MAQRRGGGMGGGSFHGGGSFGHGGLSGGRVTGFGNRGFNGFGGSVFRGNNVFFHNNSFLFNRFGFNRFGFRSFGFNNFGFGLGFGGFGGFYGYPYYPYDSGYGYSPYGSGYPAYDSNYNTSPNVTVVYPQQSQAPSTVVVQTASPVTRTYDEYGQEVGPAPGPASTASGSPLYLVAFKDHVIRAAAAYWVDGKTLHYVTTQHEEKQAPLDTVDRDFSMQLNRERHIAFQLPAQ